MPLPTPNTHFHQAEKDSGLQTQGTAHSTRNLILSPANMIIFLNSPSQKTEGFPMSHSSDITAA